METNLQSQLKEMFEKLFLENADAIYRLCLFRTSDKATADDLTQETFLRFWKALNGDSTLEQPRSYLFQIARNLIIDHYKAHKAVSLDAMQDGGFDPKDHEPTPDLIADIGLLREAIDALEPDFREAMYLRYVEGWRVKEVAEVLNISENLAAVRLNRAKDKLKVMFA